MAGNAMTDPIYALRNSGLGDHWASLNLLAHMSACQGREIAYYPRGHERRAFDILALLDLSSSARLMQHPNPAPAQLVELNGYDLWATPFYPTKHRWNLGRGIDSPYVCVHWDGISSAADKNPPVEDIEKFYEWARGYGLQVQVLDGFMPLSLVVHHLAACKLFVGCDSGFSHMAHSVGCPTYILEYRLPIVTCHRNKNYVRCAGMSHFATQADNWLHCLRSIAPREISTA